MVPIRESINLHFLFIIELTDQLALLSNIFFDFQIFRKKMDIF